MEMSESLEAMSKRERERERNSRGGKEKMKRAVICKRLVVVVFLACNYQNVLMA